MEKHAAHHENHQQPKQQHQRKVNIFSDILSGTIMAATSIPQLIAYAESAGYSSYRGLSTAGIPLLAYGCFTNHPYLNIGVTGITALMSQIDLKGNEYSSLHGEELYVELISCYTIWIGLSCLLLSIVRFPYIAYQLIPAIVRSGFRWGTALGVLINAIPNGFLLRGLKYDFHSFIIENNTSSSLFLYELYNSLISSTYYKSIFTGLVSIIQCIMIIINPISFWNIETTIIFGLSKIFIMYNGTKYIFPKFICIPGIEVILVTALGALYSVLTNYQGQIVGTIPSIISTTTTPINDVSSSSSSLLHNYTVAIMSSPIIPSVNIIIKNPNQWIQMTPILIEQVGNGSIIQFIMNTIMNAAVTFISLMGIASVFEIDDNIKWYPNYELIYLGICNIIAGIIGSAPLGGSLSRSLVSRMTGTTSSYTCIVTALCWIYLLPYISNLLTPIPKVSLSSIMISAVLPGILYPKELLHYNKSPKKLNTNASSTTTDSSSFDYYLVGWCTAIMTAITSPTNGFLFGMTLYYIVRIIRTIINKFIYFSTNNHIDINSKKTV